MEECRKAGGQPASSLDEYKRGEQFRCNQNGSGQSGPMPPEVCEAEAEAKESVDWVFRDRGARATYSRLLNEGRSPFDSVLGAQGHNPQAQGVLQQCVEWTMDYLAQLGATDDGPFLGNRKLGAQDCECISIIPVGELDAQRRPKFRVTSSCDGMNVAVRFIGDILSLSARDAFSSWGSAGLLADGLSSTISAPDMKYTSIAEISLKNATSSYSCIYY